MAEGLSNAKQRLLKGEQAHHNLFFVKDPPLPVDAVFLRLHGAMYAEGIGPAETVLVGEVRSLVGPKVPIACTFDLHGNIPARLAQFGDILAGLKTASEPERAQLLAAAIRTEVAYVLGVPAESLEDGVSMLELGLDSLMAVDLINRLRRRLNETSELTPRVIPNDEPTR
jgi:hypothetical protein